MGSHTFTPVGALASFTGATTAPAAVSAAHNGNIQQPVYRLANISTNIDCVVGWGATSAEAQANAAGNVNANCVLLLANTEQYVHVPADSVFTGITPNSTAVVYIQAGIMSAP